MSDSIKHECGIAVVRLLKPLEYYQKKYGTSLYGLNKMYLLMQKQHNRGQDGAGVATIKLDPEPGKRYISRIRSNHPQPLKDVFTQVYDYFKDLTPEQLKDAESLKNNYPFTGELLLGHLRYATHASGSIEACHPLLRQNNWITRNLVMAGNFNMTNVDELFSKLIKLGQFPKEKSDTVTVLEKIGHFLDQEVEAQFQAYKKQGFKKAEITNKINESLDIESILKKASKRFDGGYALAGLFGHGDAFVLRDPNGIRPAFYYYDEEVVVVASERPAIQTAFNVRWNQVREINPGHAIIIKKNGTIQHEKIRTPLANQSCTFERIYFSRGTDRDIYLERKKLGEHLVNQVLKAIDYDLDNTVFSYVPNTAYTAFLGLRDGLEKHLDLVKKSRIQDIIDTDAPDKMTQIQKVLDKHVRSENLVVKDVKLRTFIADDSSRSELVSHVYDVTYGIINNEVDTIVLLDDSIVRGTTLKESIISMVSKLRPKKIIIVSSAPQIRYPDCYGIDMSIMGRFVAFNALVNLLEKNGQVEALQRVYIKCKKQEDLPKEEIKNYVSELYDLFTDVEISDEISNIVTPKGIKPEVQVIYQTVEGLHKSCPNHKGDWYFTGNYPTPGGFKVLNKAFINFIEKNNGRSY